MKLFDKKNYLNLFQSGGIVRNSGVYSPHDGGKSVVGAFYEANGYPSQGGQFGGYGQGLRLVPYLYCSINVSLRPKNL